MQSGFGAEDLLDFADKRTLERFLSASGPLNATSLNDFCKQQRFIQNERILADVLDLLGDLATASRTVK